jgi:cell division protein ZapE
MNTPRSDVLVAYEQSLAKRGFVSDRPSTSPWSLQRLFEWTAYKAKRSNALKRMLVKPEPPRGLPVGRGGARQELPDGRLLPVRALVRKRRVHFTISCAKSTAR